MRRADGSGTTFIFANYLSKVNAEWKEKVGFGTAVQWPIGLGGKGNEGVAGQIKSQPASIGYIELAYAMQNKMAMATIKNRSGKFVTPTLVGGVSTYLYGNGVASLFGPNLDWKTGSVLALFLFAVALLGMTVLARTRLAKDLDA